VKLDMQTEAVIGR